MLTVNSLTELVTPVNHVNHVRIHYEEFEIKIQADRT